MEEKRIDRTIKCIDCGEEFIFNVGEQNFYRDKKLAPPKRCWNCRKIKKNRPENNDSPFAPILKKMREEKEL